MKKSFYVWLVLVVLASLIIHVAKIVQAAPPIPPVAPDVNPCVPSTEICNGIDDNCDGSIDEGGVCDATPASTPAVGGSGGGGGGAGGTYVPLNTTTNSTTIDSSTIHSNPNKVTNGSSAENILNDNPGNIIPVEERPSSITSNNKTTSEKIFTWISSQSSNPMIIGGGALFIVLLIIYAIFSISVKHAPKQSLAQSMQPVQHAHETFSNNTQQQTNQVLNTQSPAHQSNHLNKLIQRPNIPNQNPQMTRMNAPQNYIAQYPHNIAPSHNTMPLHNVSSNVPSAHNIPANAAPPNLHGNTNTAPLMRPTNPHIQNASNTPVRAPSKK